MFWGIQLQIFFASLIFVKVRLYCISEECLFYCSTSSNYCFPLGSDPTIDSHWHVLNESMKICVHFKALFPFAFAFEGINIFIRRITVREVWKKIPLRIYQDDENFLYLMFLGQSRWQFGYFQTELPTNLL